MLFALIASGCTTDDGVDYDVPARSSVNGAQFRMDADGTPVILAQVSMNYGTTGKREQWEPKYKAANVQSIVFMKRDGAWKQRPFRNLQEEYRVYSFLARNKEGHVQPLVWNRDRVSLFSRSGDDWKARSTSQVENGYYLQGTAFGPVAGDAYDFQAVMILGDSAWMAMKSTDDGKRVFLVSSSGSQIGLDTNAYASPMGFFFGAKENHLIAIRQRNASNTYPPEPPSSQVVCYSWASGAGDPHVRKRILLDSSQMVSYWGMNISGEFRLGIGSQEAVHTEVILRGDDIVRVDAAPAISTPVSVPDGKTEPTEIDLGYIPITSQTGPDECTHRLYMRQDSGSQFGKAPEAVRFLLHRSSCSALVDTLLLPGPIQTNIRNYSTFKFQFTKDGNFLVAMTGATPLYWGGGTEADQEIGPSGIYVASWTGPGKWAVDTIAEY